MKKIILYFLGICCMISSVVGFMKYGVGNGIACVLILVPLLPLPNLLFQKHKKQKALNFLLLALLLKMKAENFVPDNPFFGRYYSKIRRMIQNTKSDLKDIFTTEALRIMSTLANTLSVMSRKNSFRTLKKILIAAMWLIISTYTAAGKAKTSVLK